MINIVGVAGNANSFAANAKEKELIWCILFFGLYYLEVSTGLIIFPFVYIYTSLNLLSLDN